MEVPEKKEKWGPDKKIWISEYLEELGWSEVSNYHNKHFICPKCSKP